MKSIGIINGPNLNLTGLREPEIYGKLTFDEFMLDLRKEFPGTEFLYFQSNIEGELINCIQDWGFSLDALVINAGGYTHTSVALGDAVKAIKVPVIEVHLSNIFAREEYRHSSFIGAAAIGTITGFGMDSYRMACRYFIDHQD